jgi:DNA modification methylase
MTNLRIEYQPISALVPCPNNPRTHSKKQIEQIARSLRHFGFTNPVLIDDRNGIVAGHGRVAAARLIGLADIPTVRLRDMSEADIRAYVIADNKLAENAGWDRTLLALEFQYLSELEDAFDLSLTGFELPEIDVALAELVPDGGDGGPDPADEVPEVAPGPAVTQPGDIWHIGAHRLICGNSLARETYAALLDDARAQMVFTDPPYNVPIGGHVCGSGSVQHREFAMASGEMSPAEFTDFLSRVFAHLAEFSADGSIHFQCMDWRHMGEMLSAGGKAYGELKNLCVWAKTNGGMGSLYRSQHELVFVFKAGRAPHINNVELGRHGRYRTNVWTYPGVNSFGGGQDDLALHPTVKPAALVRDAILDCSHRNGIVLDAFAGSGTTLVAAEQTGRRGFGIEIDPHYCDVILRRLGDLCGLKARLGEDGSDFAAVAAQRRSGVLQPDEPASRSRGAAA